jgi:hypothetical protein
LTPNDWREDFYDTLATIACEGAEVVFDPEQADFDFLNELMKTMRHDAASL